MAAANKRVSPFLKRVSVLEGRIARRAFPFDTLKFLTRSFAIDITSPITIVVGENGSVKSPSIEALSVASGFNVFGGSQHHRGFGSDGEPPNALAAALEAFLANPDRFDERVQAGAETS